MTAMLSERQGVPRSASADEDVLWQALQKEGSSEAREALFKLYLPLARRSAARHFNRGARSPVPFEDLLQFAHAGLLEAIDRFRPELGVPFRFYGNRRMTGSILNGIALHSEVNQQISHCNRAARERLASLKAQERIQGSPLEVMDILGEIAAGLALGLLLEESRVFVADQLDPERSAYETLAWKQMVALVGNELENLPTRQRDIVRFHYLDGMSFEQLGALFGVTKGRISQLHKAAIALLRKRLLHTGPFRFDG